MILYHPDSGREVTVHPDATGTQTILKRAGYRLLTAETLPDADVDLGDVVGEDLAGRLAKAGFRTTADIREASDDELRAVPGVGKATVAKLRKASAT